MTALAVVEAQGAGPARLFQPASWRRCLMVVARQADVAQQVVVETRKLLASPTAAQRCGQPSDHRDSDCARPRKHGRADIGLRIELGELRSWRSSPRFVLSGSISAKVPRLLRRAPKRCGLRARFRRSRFAAMTASNKLAVVAACAGDPARASMLNALVDGRAFTAGELSSVARITPQTASGHLARMVDAGLLDGREPGAASLLSAGIAAGGDDARKHDGGRRAVAPYRPHRSGGRKPAFRAHLLRSSCGPARGRHRRQAGGCGSSFC